VTKTAHIVLGAPSDGAVFPVPEPDDVVIGVDRGAVECLSRGIRLTMAVGDFDSISATEKNKLQSTVDSLLDYDSDKDETDAEIALTLALKDETVSAVSIYNWSGGRFDHLLSILYLIYQPRFKSLFGRLTFYDAANTVAFYEPGEYSIQKEASKKYLSFIGMTPLKGLTLKEVKYPLSNQSYAYPRALISNEFLNDTCHFSFNEGILAVVQSADK